MKTSPYLGVVRHFDEEKDYGHTLTQLQKCSLTGTSEALRQKMLGDTFVLNDIAILGQWTTLYASPNTGKTLLTLWLLRESIDSGQIDSEKVFYINADDHYRGLVEKTELAEEYCMHMIAPHHKEFDVKQVPEMMEDMARDGSANGVVFILDTLKKFTDLMNKQVASDFGIAARAFVSAGGTLIALAHTNKHKDADGKGIYSGTSDIVDDSDCCFILDKISETDSVHTIEFRNIKMRGDVASLAGFTYQKHPNQSYMDLLDSVQRIEKEDIENSRTKARVQEKLVEDQPIIKAVCEAIAGGTNTKDKLIKAVQAQTGESSRRVKKVLEDRTGDMHMFGHRWTISKGTHNKHVYAVLPSL